jgi:hypothetical protein
MRGAQVVVIGAQSWLRSTPTGPYQADDSVLTFARFFDPQTGIGALLTQIVQPQSPESYKDIWVTYGAIAADRLSGVIPELAGRTDLLTIHVDISKRDHQLVGMNLEGALFPGESAHLSHIFSLSQFNVPVDIQPPTTSSPLAVAVAGATSRDSYG